MLTTFTIALVASASVACALIASEKYHGHLTGDAQGTGPQKIHDGSVPRVGGVGIFLGFCSALLYCKAFVPSAREVSAPIWLILALSVPFAAGLLEDITKRVRPAIRLMATFIGAGIAFFFCNAALSRFDVPGVDALLALHPIFQLAFTLFCVGGIAHAFNLSDGLNGLLGGLVCTASLGLALVAWRLGDQHILFSALALCGATAGFLLGNYPWPRIFAGDGGAYFCGTAVALLCIMLVARNPSISPWSALAMVLYPFTDTACAILRRLIQRRPISQPDAEHLHTLLARWLSREYPVNGRNFASFLIVATTFPVALTGSAIAASTPALVGLAIAYFVTFACVYFALYRRVVSGPATSDPVRAESTASSD
jgi:UDP-N-acetylmuramyl pentapeptide phosphotransferase/UDP-N-acetylglucosamine-1-phosphate transferase